MFMGKKDKQSYFKDLSQVQGLSHHFTPNFLKRLCTTSGLPLKIFCKGKYATIYFGWKNLEEVSSKYGQRVSRVFHSLKPA